MASRSIFFYLAVAFLFVGMLVTETEARRKILRGRKTITRRYYMGTAIPAWSIVVISGLGMLVLGGGLYILLKKLVVDSVEISEIPSYQPASQDDV